MKKIGDILNEDATSPYAGFWKLSGIWKEAVTKDIAEVTVPVKLDAAGLLVIVRDNIWFTELNYLKEEIKERLSQKGLRIEDITFKYKQSYEKVKKLKRRSYDITPEKKIFIDEITGKMNNKELKICLEKAMNAYFKKYEIKEFIGK